ncbi:MAG: PAS domain S-box protein [Bacteroidales bacterium]|nr:PAS domain S-box protein [Bacteroidales bacterium]
MNVKKRKPLMPWHLLIVFAVVFLVLIMVGYSYYLKQKEEIKEETHQFINTTNTYKGHQIVNWRQERINDLFTLSQNQSMLNTIKGYLKNGNEEHRQSLIKWMNSWKEHFDYRKIYLVTPDKEYLIGNNSQDEKIHKSTVKYLDQARQSGSVVFSPLHKTAHDDVHIGLIAPLYDNMGKLISYMVLEINPDRFLYPIIEQATIPSQTGETILFKASGSGIEFLSDLRFMKNSILKQYVPTEKENIFYKIATQVDKGLIQGTDYRGAKVLASVEKLDGTPWFILTKTDVKEVYGLFRTSAIQTAVILLLILILTAVVLYVVWRRQSYRYYRHQLDLERERSSLLKQHDYLTRYANDIIIMYDENGRIIEANEKASRTYGYSIEEMLAMKIDQLRASEKEPLSKELTSEKGNGGMVYETNHKKSNGTEIPVEISSRPIEVEDTTYYQMIIRDISERKKVEEELRIQKAYFEDLFEYAPEAIAILDNEDRVIQVNREFENLFGYSLNEASGKQINDLIVPDDLTEEGWNTTNAVASGDSIELESIRISKEGTRIPVSITGKPILLSGNQLAVYGIYRNIEERHKSEEKLKRLTQFARENPNPVITVNKDGKIIYANQGAEPLLAMWKTQLHQKAPESIINHIKHSLENDEQETVEVHFNKLYYLLSLSPNKESGRVHIYGSDITERKHADLTREIMFNIANATNTTQNISELSDVIRTELDKVTETKNFLIILYDEDKDTLSLPYIKDEKDEFEEFPAGKTLSAYVIRKQQPMLFRERDMELLEEKGEIETIGTPAKVWLGVPLIVDNKVIGIIVVQNYEDENVYTEEDLENLRFISSQIAVSIRNKRIEEEVRKLSVSVQQSPVSVVITNTEGQIEYVNPKFTQLTGYTLKEVYKKNPRILKSGHTPKEEYQRLWQTIKSGNEWKGELRNRRKNGELFWISSSISPIKDNYGKIHHFVAINEDITDRKKMEKDLIDAKEKAEESDRLKSAFLATMSHELRTPLNAVIGFSELIDEGLSTEEILEYAENINKSGKHLLEIIEDLFNISIIESGDVDIEKKEFNINNLLDEIKMNIQTDQVNLEREDLTIKVFKDLDDSKCQIHSDPAFIKQIFNNLLKNALKFTEEGAIEFGYSVESRNIIRFFVKDTGIGIAPDKQDIIFERFRQADEGFTRKYEGTGLGLSISKRLVELLNGSIWVDSEPDNGSTFYFTIPYESSEQEEEPAAEEAGELVWPGRRILIAEDDESNFELLKSMLKKTKIEVERAHNGVQAVDLFKKYTSEDRKGNGPCFDLILMDIKMPKMGGYEATQQIKEIDPETTVIAQTAFAMKGDEDKAIEAGCDDYITKPIKKEALLLKMNKYLSKK